MCCCRSRSCWFLVVCWYIYFLVEDSTASDMNDLLLPSWTHSVVQPLERFTVCSSAASGGTELWECLSAEAFVFSLAVMLFMGCFCFVASCVTNNDSWIDRFWSIIPVVYAWIFTYFKRYDSVAASPLAWNSSCVVFSTLISLWGARLTYNFYRKGGYRCGGEDYRWMYVRSWPIFQRAPLLWYPFSFVVVSMFQAWLLWAIALPVMLLPGAPLTAADALFAGLFLVFLALETLTDQQQWEFQNEKRRLRPRRSDVNYDLGFCIDGAFAFSRHLNVWAEQSIWVCVFLAGASHAHGLHHVFVVGCVTLVALTIGSTRLTETISLSKYPLYAVYQQTTPMLVPTLRATDSRTTYLVGKASS